MTSQPLAHGQGQIVRELGHINAIVNGGLNWIIHVTAAMLWLFFSAMALILLYRQEEEKTPTCRYSSVPQGVRRK